MKQLLLIILSVLLCASCSDDTEICKYLPKVIDESGTLPNEAKEIFLNQDYPAGIVPVLYHTDEIKPLIRTGSYADELFKRLCKELPEGPDLKKRGLLVIVSDNPKLLQTRMGSKYQTYCNMSGITMGQEYFDLQYRTTLEGPIRTLPILLQNISIRIHELNSLSYHKKWRISQMTSAVENILEYAGTPSENLYGKWILRPIMTLMSFMLHLSGLWLIALLFTIAILYICRIFINWVVGLLVKGRMQVSIKIVTNLLLSFIFSVSTVVSALVLSSGRLEDIIALRCLGVPYMETLVKNIASYTNGTSMVIIILFVLLFSCKLVICTNDFLYNLYPSSQQMARFSKESDFQKILRAGLMQADIQKVEQSKTPYTELFASGASHKFGASMAGLSMAALFLLPNIVMLVGIAYALNALLIQGFRIHVILRQSATENEKMEQHLNLGVFLLLAVFGGGMCLGLGSLFNPMPERSVIDPAQAVYEVIQPSRLIGNYTFEKKVEQGVSEYGSGVLEMRDDGTFVLLITGRYDPRVYALTYRNMCFYSDELGEGTVHYDRELDAVKILFNINNITTWTLTK
ncbi:hypothetical protein [Parabacteroides sp.]|uniref:hypothetical protein n=1 Tax=Parabacteroides sp. TaxID=1869337 RepID=UPI0026E01881|nr:hypothetical protein [Parabacteroides sp.]MDO5428032.1 hypothetical protein [Parabacteroides sp.]